MVRNAFWYLATDVATTFSASTIKAQTKELFYRRRGGALAVGVVSTQRR